MRSCVILQVARSALAKFGSFLRRVVPWLFEIVLEVYVRWMASGGRQYDVPSRTVSSLLKEHKLATVQLLKVDVEGAEVQVWCRVRDVSNGFHTCVHACTPCPHEWMLVCSHHL